MGIRFERLGTRGQEPFGLNQETAQQILEHIRQSCLGLLAGNNSFETPTSSFIPPANPIKIVSSASGIEVFDLDRTGRSAWCYSLVFKEGSEPEIRRHQYKNHPIENDYKRIIEPREVLEWRKKINETIQLITGE